MEDPNRFDDPFSPEGHLHEGETCVEADPAATPRPSPELVAGEWRDSGGALYCGHQPFFGVRAEFLLGGLRGCGASFEPSLEEETPERVRVSNQDEDQHVLVVSWLDSPCTDGATVSFFPLDGRYRTHVIATAGPCHPLPDGHDQMLVSVTLMLVDPVAAGGVSTDYVRAGD
jgi:hypothetical protein